MYEELKQFIDARIYPNGQQRITGQHHQDALHAVVDTLGGDIAQKRDLTDKEVFIAQPGSTTFEQMAAAFAAKKAVFIATAYQNKGDIPVVLPLVTRREVGENRVEFVFAGLVDDGPAAVSLVWSREQQGGSTVDTLPDYATRTVLATATALNGKYTKPADGIPVSDLDSGDIDNEPTEDSGHLVKSGGVYSAIGQKYTKPSGGIPENDLSQAVQDKLNSGGGGAGPLLLLGNEIDDSFVVNDSGQLPKTGISIETVIQAFLSGRQVLFAYSGNQNNSVTCMVNADANEGVIYFGGEIHDTFGEAYADHWNGEVE